jgi:hypothetical protein
LYTWKVWMWERWLSNSERRVFKYRFFCLKYRNTPGLDDVERCRSRGYINLGTANKGPSVIEIAFEAWKGKIPSHSLSGNRSRPRTLPEDERNGQRDVKACTHRARLLQPMSCILSKQRVKSGFWLIALIFRDVLQNYSDGNQHRMYTTNADWSAPSGFGV